jgi:hypothetical protein
MGTSFRLKTCSSYRSQDAVAPNPQANRWELLKHHQFKGFYVLKVKYLDCTNFEGVKIMIYKGKFDPKYKGELDPHFSESWNSPVVRVKPSLGGWMLALQIASALSETFES